MIKKFRTLLLIITAMAAALIYGCGSGNKEGADAAAGGTAAVPADGNISASILSVTISSPPVVTFTLHDEKGNALDPNALLASSGGRLRFYIGQLDPDTGYYKNYIGTAAGLPTFDPAGTFATVGDGIYTYTFKTDITDPAKTLNGLVYNATRTHTVAAQMQRTVPSNSGGTATFQQVVNPYLTFRPDGGAVTVTREVVAVSNCNECHDKLALHGGGRREVALCILCHYPGVADPDTGNAIDFKSMIHKIHMGQSLPSNQGGGNFTISSSSFGGVTYPFMSGDGDISGTPIECVKCHRQAMDLVGKSYGRDVNKWKEVPRIENCTTCHDDLSVATDVDGRLYFAAQRDGTVLGGANGKAAVPFTFIEHPGGTGTTFKNDSCADCHVTSDPPHEYDMSVPGLHTILEKSSVFVSPSQFLSTSAVVPDTVVEDITFRIVSVTNATPGNKPVVTFKVTHEDDSAYTSLTDNNASFNLKVGYFPVIDYTNNLMVNYGQPVSQSASGAAANGDGTWTVTVGTAIPATAIGTGVIGLEGRRNYTVTKPDGSSQTFSIGGKAVQYYFDLATGLQVDDPAKQRRQVVDVEKCKLCHSRLTLHGSNRVNNISECVICHNPDATDKGRRPDPSVATADGLAEQTIDFKVMIHKIHSGENLTIKPYGIYGFGSTFNDFSDVTYPQDRRNCLGCHLPGTYGLPLKTGILGTTIVTGSKANDDSDNSRRQPMTSVCTSCHDDHLSHATTFTDATLGEQCFSCHASGIAPISWNIAHRPVR